MICGLIATGAALWGLWCGVPEAYRLATVLAEEAQARERAEALERGAATALSQRRHGDEPWTVEIKEEDAAAWAAHRLPRWLENRGERWPGGWSQPRARFEGGRVFIGVLDAGGRVLGVSGVPIVEGASLRLLESRVTLGRLAVPATALADRIANQTLRDAITGTVGVEARATLDDGRSVSVERVEVVDGRLRVTCRTHPAR